MATFLELQTRVQTRIIDLPTAVQDEVPDLVNDAIKSLQEDHNFKVMEKVASFPTVVDTRSIGSVPSDFKEYRGKPYILRDDGTTMRLTVAANVQSIHTAFTDADTGEPLALLDSDAPSETGARTLGVYPLPDGNADYDDGEYVIKVPYWRWMTALSASGDTNWFTVEADRFIVNWATSEGFALDWDLDQMAIWAQRAEVERRKVVKKDKLYRVSSVDTFVPHWRGARDTTLDM